MRPARIRLRLAATVIVAGLALAGCGSGPTAAGTTAPAASSTAASSTAPAAVNAFPVSIDTAYGKVTVPEKPERILVLSTTYLELLPYLDEAPLASPDSDEDIASYSPWLVGLDRGQIDDRLIDSEYLISAEAVAAQDPDLILTDIWNADEALYAQLSQIAPTYVGIDTDTNTSWQNNLGALAELTGHDPAVVDKVETDLNSKLAAAAASVPGLTGASFQVAALGADEQLWLTEYANAPLLALGLTPGPGQPTTGAEGTSAPTYSRENIDQLTADVLFLATDHRDPQGAWRVALQADPRVAELPSSRNGTFVYLNGPQWSAVNGGTPMSILWWLDQVLPALKGSALAQKGQ